MLGFIEHKDASIFNLFMVAGVHRETHLIWESNTSWGEDHTINHKGERSGLKSAWFGERGLPTIIGLSLGSKI